MGERTAARIERGLVLTIPLLFLVAGLIRAWPFVDDVPLDGPQGDDWFFYKKLAVSIVEGGMSIPAIDTYALVPHGFLYNYFVAAVFGVFGTNTAFVYVIQTALVGLSASLLWHASRRTWSHAGGIGFLLLAGTVLYVDFVQRLSFRLLSENLFLVLMAACLASIALAFERRSHAWALVAGLLLGLTVLSRTSVVVAALGIMALGWGAAWFGRRMPFSLPGAFTAGLIVAMCLLPLREYAAIGRPNFDLITHTQDFVVPPEGLGARAEYYSRRLLFILGATGFVNAEYRPRPHWVLVWAGVAGYAVTRLRSRRWPSAPEAAVLVFLPLYLGPVLLVAGVDNYGGRMVAAAIPLAAVLATRFASDMLEPRVPRERTGTAAGYEPADSHQKRD